MHRPLVRTVLQKAESYQHLLDLASGQNASEGIRQGLEDVRKGRSRPAREVFADSKPSVVYRVNSEQGAEKGQNRLLTRAAQ
jgi:hypothetical protein